MIRYDAWKPDEPAYYRAKEHFDRGFATLQADETDQGLWMKLPGQEGDGNDPIPVPYNDGYSRFFLGVSFDVLYEQGKHPISPLTHGVFGPKPGDKHRYSTILFADPPRYDMNITSLDTQRHRVDKENLDI